MQKWLIIGLVAAAVLLIARRASADPGSPAYVADPGNWNTLPGYRQGTGLML